MYVSVQLMQREQCQSRVVWMLLAILPKESMVLLQSALAIFLGDISRDDIRSGVCKTRPKYLR